MLTQKIKCLVAVRNDGKFVGFQDPEDAHFVSSIVFVDDPFFAHRITPLSFMKDDYKEKFFKELHEPYWYFGDRYKIDLVNCRMIAIELTITSDFKYI